MSLNLESTLLNDVPFTPSPNCDERPENIDINLIVIHGISLPPDSFGSQDIDLFFTNQLDAAKHPYYQTIADLKVSAHLLIRRDGDMTQFVPFSKRAWHAGDSSFEGKNNCNDYSIGIELEGSDAIPYTDRQYRRLAAVVCTLMSHYPAVIPARIVGHADVAPGRKTDPGASFEWDTLHNYIKEQS